MRKTSNKYKYLLCAELAFSFAVLPSLLSIYKVRSLIYSVLVALSIICFIILKKYYNYSFTKDLNLRAVNRRFIKELFPRILTVYLTLFFFTYLVIPAKLFSFPTERPSVWFIVMIWYPLFSVLPQEFLYRSYFYHRFKVLFSKRYLWIVSGVLFGWAHIILQNWVAISFTVIGGLFFARTYERTQSLAAAIFEHALYGCWVFTLGLGVYFYHGLAVK
ncbi:MAG: type II CAAX endopeptidase family protein [Rickettsiales bacterium]